MKRVAKWTGRLIGVLAVVSLLLWAFGPYEPVETDVDFSGAALGVDLDRYFAAREAEVPNLKPGVQKQVIWAGETGAQTPVALVYIHGFSATSGEIRPVPDRLAEELGANLVYTRLSGHGRDGDAMAEATIGAWMEDVAEALAAGRRVGEKVVVISTSTGGTLVTLAAERPGAMENVAGLVFVSPNFGVNNPAAALLTMPAARLWLPLLVGAERSFEPRNEAQATLWTTRYPTVAVLPMAASVKAAMQVDVSKIDIPALFLFSDADRVVRPDLTRQVAGAWGGPVQIVNPDLGPDDDAYAHVIAGDVMSPGQTDGAVQVIYGFIQGL